MAHKISNRSDPRTPRARVLRHQSTPAERKLWAALKLLPLAGSHFRRQAPIGPYFTDFVHHGSKLVIELDGDQHGHQAGVNHDARRTAYLEAQGYRVLRFWNHEVVQNCDGVIETILAAFPPTPSPSLPQAGGGEIVRADAAFSVLQHHRGSPLSACGGEGLGVGGDGHPSRSLPGASYAI